MKNFHSHHSHNSIGESEKGKWFIHLSLGLCPSYRVQTNELMSSLVCLERERERETERGKFSQRRVSD